MKIEKGNSAVDVKGNVISDSTKPEDLKSILEETGEYPEDYIQELMQEIKDRGTQIARDMILIPAPIEKTKTKSGIFINVGLLSEEEKYKRYNRYHRVVGVGAVTNGMTITPGVHSIWLMGGNVKELPIGDKLVVAVAAYDVAVVVEFDKLKRAGEDAK